MSHADLHALLHGEHDVGVRSIGAEPRGEADRRVPKTEIGVLQQERITIDGQLGDEERPSGLKSEGGEQRALRKGLCPGDSDRRDDRSRAFVDDHADHHRYFGTLGRRRHRIGTRTDVDRRESQAAVEVLDGAGIRVEHFLRERVQFLEPDERRQVGFARRRTRHVGLTAGASGQEREEGD